MRCSFQLEVAHTRNPLDYAACLCAPCRAPAPAVIPLSILPPISNHGLHPGPCWPLILWLSWVPLCLFAPASPSMCVLHVLAYSGSLSLFSGVHFAQGRGVWVSPLPVSRSHQTPPTLPSSPSPLVVLIPQPRLNFVGRGARSCSYMRMLLSWLGLLGLPNQGPGLQNYHYHTLYNYLLYPKPS